MKPYALQPGTIAHRAHVWMTERTRERVEAGSARFTCTTAEFNAALDTGMDDASFITCLNKARYAGYFHVGRDHGPNGRPRLVWSLGDGRQAPMVDNEDKDEPLNATPPPLPTSPVSALPSGERVRIERPANDGEAARPYRATSGRPPADARPPAPAMEATGPGWKFNGKVAPKAEPPAPPPGVWPKPGESLPDARTAWPLIVTNQQPGEFMAGCTGDGSLIVERGGVRVRYTPEEARLIARVMRGAAACA